ncbi:MAG TPA: YbhB/YbcL family Raf kinase inhibitor-like protein [Verrucomicrobiae bacterium]|jgi:hypothetical protein
MKITSQAFKDGGNIPEQYTMYGENRIPPIHFDQVPSSARSLALIVDDPGTSKGTFNHWLLFNMDPKVKDIREGCVPVMAAQGKNDFGETEYDGPKPPSGEHQYFFHLYALNTVLPISRGSTREAFDRAMDGHILESATLMGKYAHEMRSANGR